MHRHNVLNSPYYIIELIIPKEHAEINPSHEEVKGHRCTIISIHTGRSAQLLVDFDWDTDPHIYRTSQVKYCSMIGDTIVIETMNTTYLLRKEKEF